MIRRQKLLEDVDLSISMGLDQNYSRADFSEFITLGPAGVVDPSLPPGIQHAHRLSMSTSINLTYKNISAGVMFSEVAGIPSSYPTSPYLTAFAEADFIISEESEINTQFYLLHRGNFLTVLSPQVRARHKWLVLRLGYWIHRSVMGGAGVHFGKNDFLLMIHRAFNGAQAFGPTFEVSYVRNLKALKN